MRIPDAVRDAPALRCERGKSVGRAFVYQRAVHVQQNLALFLCDDVTRPDLLECRPARHTDVLKVPPPMKHVCVAAAYRRIFQAVMPLTRPSQTPLRAA